MSFPPKGVEAAYLTNVSDVVHTICYSLLLLNTDLHVADLDQKMTRSQFLKNTLPTIRKMAQDYLDPNLTVRQQCEPRRGSIPWQTQRSPSPLAFESRLSGDAPSSSSRQGNRPPLPRAMSDEAALSSPSPYDGRSHDASELLVNAPHEGTLKNWEEAMEAILKEFYLSIRQLRLPLHGSSETQLQGQPSSTSLSAVSNFMRRTGSVMSKTPFGG